MQSNTTESMTPNMKARRDRVITVSASTYLSIGSQKVTGSVSAPPVSMSLSVQTIG